MKTKRVSELKSYNAPGMVRPAAAALALASFIVVVLSFSMSNIDGAGSPLCLVCFCAGLGGLFVSVLIAVVWKAPILQEDRVRP